MSKDIQKYISCMEEIKRRIDVIYTFLCKKRSTGYLMTDSEFIVLQFRKVLELIALSSLCANREKYEETRNKFHKEWNADQIMKHIERINPYFYPTPSRQVINIETGKVERTDPITAGFLTKEDFRQILGKCGFWMHANNPYGKAKPPNPKKLWEMFHEWKDKITKLLNHHHAQLVDEEKQLWVIMQASSDGKVHVYEFAKVKTS